MDLVDEYVGRPWFYSLLITAAFAGLAYSQRLETLSRSALGRRLPRELVAFVRSSVEQAEERSVVAASLGNNRAQQMREANFGRAYLNSARALATDLEIEEICPKTQVDVLINHLEALQNAAFRVL